MALIRIPERQQTLDGQEAVSNFLATYGITYERWESARTVPTDADAAAVLQIYADKIDMLKARGGYTTADVIDVTPATPNLDAMLAKVDSKTALVYICNPNNPTASLTPRADIESFLRKLPPSVYVLIDEAYHHYVNASARYVSFLDQPARNDRVIVIRTFSKVYAMAGLRLGYGVTDHILAAKMRSLLTDVDLNCAAVAAGKVALTDSESLRNFVKRNMDDRQEFFNQAMARMLKPIDSQTNFVMMDTRHPADSIIEHFLKNKIRIGRHFPPLNNHIRISLGTPPAMQEFWRVWDLMPHSKMSM